MNSRGQCFSRAKKSYRRSEQREEVTILEVQVTKRGVRGLRHGRSGLTAIASTVDYFSRRGSDKYVTENAQKYVTHKHALISWKRAEQLAV